MEDQSEIQRLNTGKPGTKANPVKGRLTKREQSYRNAQRSVAVSATVGLLVALLILVPPFTWGAPTAPCGTDAYGYGYGYGYSPCPSPRPGSAGSPATSTTTSAVTTTPTGDPIKQTLTPPASETPDPPVDVEQAGVLQQEQNDPPSGEPSKGAKTGAIVAIGAALAIGGLAAIGFYVRGRRS